MSEESLDKFKGDLYRFAYATSQGRLFKSDDHVRDYYDPYVSWETSGDVPPVAYIERHDVVMFMGEIRVGHDGFKIIHKFLHKGQIVYLNAKALNGIIEKWP